jgi:antitoxin component YwqK of YwqJK toxin-antitoxin module
MKLIKIFLKSILAIFGIIILFVVALRMGESYEITDKNTDKGIIKIETKKFFSKKLFEASFNESGFYHGDCTSWNMIGDQKRQEGQYENGYWHGRWKEYDKNGNVQMIREWDRGKLMKLFLPKNDTFIEVPKEQWPKYVDIQQKRPERAKQ